jgi:hypothetical protein
VPISRTRPPRSTNQTTGHRGAAKLTRQNSRAAAPKSVPNHSGSHNRLQPGKIAPYTVFQ